MEDLEDIQNKLNLHKQEHLLAHYADLTIKEKQSLIGDLKDVDFQYLEDIRRKKRSCSTSSTSVMEPIPTEQFGSASRGREDEKAEWEKLGLACIAEGKVAVLVLAGGQGTRLGVSYPKGMYNVGIPSGKTLYQVNAEKIKRLEELAFERTGKRGIITWYIMTSEATMKQTEEFFEEHKYFGLSEKNVLFFEQFTLPCTDFHGKILLSKKHEIARAPDGNGGLYKALKQRCILDDMERRGVECVHVHCVDNILQKSADPVFIGFCQKLGADCGAKVVEKTDPNEAVGVVCKVDGVYQVVEYSEISKETAEKRDKNGRLLFNAGNICNHYFTTEFLKFVCGSKKDLPHHVAKKKIPHVNENGLRVVPTKPNGEKMEKFVFDVFQFAKYFAVFEVSREDEFSPLKNGEGASSCSPLQARWSLASLHHRQIIDAGGRIVDENGVEVEPLIGVEAYSGEYPIQCEISPLLSYDGENMDVRVRGHSFRSPVILQEDIHQKNGGST